MDLEIFKRTDACRKMNYSRCIYVVRPTTNEEMGIKAYWYKVGQSKTSLVNRLRQYLTALPYGIDVLAVATVRQPLDCDEMVVSSVEKLICDSDKLAPTRIRKTESFRHTPWALASILKSLRGHPDVQQVWVPSRGFLRLTSASSSNTCDNKAIAIASSE